MPDSSQQQETSEKVKRVNKRRLAWFMFVVSVGSFLAVEYLLPWLEARRERARSQTQAVKSARSQPQAVKNAR